MYDVACEFACAIVRSKDAQKQLARTSLSHMVASVRHFGYSRSSGLAPGRVYFDDVTVFR